MNAESRRMLLANVDLIIPAVAVVAICSTQAWRVCCADLLLFFSAIAVYALLSKHFKVKGRPGRPSCKESIDSLEQDYFTQSQEEELNQALDALEESCTDQLDQAHDSCCNLESVCEPVAEEQPIQHQSDTVSEQIEAMQKCASARNIAGTMCIFEELQQSGTCMTSVMYNAVLQAWINCGNVEAAEDWMESIRDAGMADIVSFNTLIKTLVKTRALDKAQILWGQMREASIEPNIATFNELLSGCARENHFVEGFGLLEEMHRSDIQPSIQTIDAIVRLLNGCRSQEESSDRIQFILGEFKFKPDKHGNWSYGGCVEAGAEACSAPIPHLMGVISRGEEAPQSLCHHEMIITGTWAPIQRARRTLKQYGFLDRANNDDWPLNGHWETEHGLTVVIEGKMVRWSRQRASRLHFAGADRRSCVLALYGEAAQGRLETPGSSPGSTKTLRWTNGDVWHSYDGRVIGQATFFSQTMTKALRDHGQDKAYRARSNAVLRCVGTNGLNMPSIVEDIMLEFIGNNLHYIHLSFDSKWSPRSMDTDTADADMFDSISERNPRVGFRHCWAGPDEACYGQRTLVNGEEVDEERFSRHVQFVVRR